MAYSVSPSPSPSFNHPPYISVHLSDADRPDFSKFILQDGLNRRALFFLHGLLQFFKFQKPWCVFADRNVYFDLRNKSSSDHRSSPPIVSVLIRPVGRTPPFHPNTVQHPVLMSVCVGTTKASHRIPIPSDSVGAIETGGTVFRDYLAFIYLYHIVTASSFRMSKNHPF